MRIYTKIVIEMATGKVLERQSYDYSGKIAACCSRGAGAAPAPPGPGPEEQALISAQTELALFQLSQAQISSAEREALYPVLLESAGLKYDPEGKIVKRGLTPAEQEVEEIAGLKRGRQLKALKGELDVDPVLEERLTTRKQELIGGLQSRLGSRWAETTPGQSALAKFEQTAGLLRGASRRAELTAGEQFYLTATGAVSGLRQQAIQPFQQLTSFRSRPSTTEALVGLQQAQQPFQFERELQKSRWY